MARGKKIAVLVAAVVLVAVLVGSGSTGMKSNSSAKAQVVHVWTTFFAGTTPAPKKVQLLQNGQQFAAIIKAQAGSSLARQTRVTVTKVTFVSSTRAKVVYTIYLAGKPALKNQIGLAVRVGGTWKVGDASFCALLALEGSKPPPCKHV
jgi:hypothetical protein